MAARLCLNMIVKNEAARLERCLSSVVPWIDYYVIVDTGSTDDTVAMIKRFFSSRGIKGTIHKAPFKTWEQARNAALTYARAAKRNWDYLLLVDADMELMVQDTGFKNKLTESVYTITQRTGTISYYNVRLVRADQTAMYRGVTHEYFDKNPDAPLHSIWFQDHADGANRPEKFKRDIRLLKEGLKKEPDNARYVFYLAQSYRDAGLHPLAADKYRQRVRMGGWDEEVWNAQFNLAHELGSMGDEGGFLLELVRAYNMRPKRAEPLHDLAKHYREKGMTDASLLFSSLGMTIPYPQGDTLFIADYVYKYGLREDFAICAFYNERYRDNGFLICDGLSLDANIPDGARELARNNLYHYLPPITDFFPSFVAKRIEFTAPDGYHPMNPSVALSADGLSAILRSVNYVMDEEGRYLIRSGDGSITNSNPIHTRNYLAKLSDDLDVVEWKEILLPRDWPEPVYPLVLGFEDMRLFRYDGSWWVNACVRSLNPEGWCEQVVARIDAFNHLTDWVRMLPAKRQHEKNWMPVVGSSGPNFVYRIGTMITPDGTLSAPVESPIDVNSLSGGSQAIPFEGGHLVLVHQARPKPGSGTRFYWHRFVWFDDKQAKVSPPFYFRQKQIEFAAGLAWHPDGQRLVISFGVRDNEAWIGTVAAKEVAEFALQKPSRP